MTHLNSIDSFYKFVHVGFTILIIGLIFNVWLRFLQIEKKTYAHKSSSSNSLLLMCLALIIWEYNLFDEDPQFEVITTFIADSTLLTAVIYFHDGILFFNSKWRDVILRGTPIVTIILILLSRTLANVAGNNQFLAYSLALAYTLLSFFIICRGLVRYYRKRGMVEIGFAAIVFFAGLFATMLLPVMYPNDMEAFARIKAFYLMSTFGVYLLFANLSFNFLQDLINLRLTKIFTQVKTAETDANQPLHTLVDIPNLVVEDKIEEAIETLVAASKTEPEKMTDVLLLANRLSSLNTTRLRGTIEMEEYRVERRRIIDSVLAILQEESA